MQFLFIIDPLASLKAYKDSTVTMLREAHRRGHALYVCEQTSVAASEDAIQAGVTRITIGQNDADWYAAHESAMRKLASFDAVVMRKDPPFDMEYVASTWLLSAAEREFTSTTSPAVRRETCTWLPT